MMYLNVPVSVSTCVNGLNSQLKGRDFQDGTKHMNQLNAP